MIFHGELLREVVSKTNDGIELRNEYGRCCRILFKQQALGLDLDLFVGVGNRRRIRFLRPCTQTSRLNAGSRTTQRMKDGQGVNIAHPMVREHRRLGGIEQ